MSRKKHRPQRTCVGCREVQGKQTLTRLVRTPDGVQLDPGGKAPGRGAYLHDRRSCWETALAGSLERALRTTLSARDRERLQEVMEQMAGSTERTE